MKIGRIRFHGGARGKGCRLGLSHIFLEFLEILISTNVRVLINPVDDAGRGGP